MENENNVTNVTENDLEQVVGGGATENRYDPNVCPTLKRTRYECVGFLSGCWCDHYSKLESFKMEHNGKKVSIFIHTCARGCFNYTGLENGEPVSAQK